MLLAMTVKNMPSISLYSSYDICAAHRLYNKKWSAAKNKSVYGMCTNLHGHQYKLEILIEGNLNPETGMLLNGFTVDSIVKKKVLSRIDHKYINDDIPYFKKHPSTAEWICVWVFEELKKAFPKGCALKKVRIYETPALFAEYHGL